MPHRNTINYSFLLLNYPSWPDLFKWNHRRPKLTQWPYCVIAVMAKIIEFVWDNLQCFLRYRNTVNFLIQMPYLESKVYYLLSVRLLCYNLLKSPQISKVSAQTASNTPWIQVKAFLLRILQYSCPVKSIVNYPIQTLIFSPWPLLRNTATAWAWAACDET